MPYQEFHRLLLDDPALLNQLRGLEREAFLEAALRLAAQAGIDLRRENLEQALVEARGQLLGRLL